MAERKRVSVKPSQRTNFGYGFYTSLDNAEQQVLGHAPITGALSEGVVWGANSPKPGRMRRVRDTGRSTSSFVSHDARANAIANGWRIVKPARASTGRGGAFTKAVYVRLSVGSVVIQYAWRMPLTTYNAIGGERTVLGVRDVTATEDPFDLVFGSTPKPPRAQKVIAGGTVSTFFDPDVDLPAGWNAVGGIID
ncbi:hypothetical protein [Egbenema bharatensis]|uniref:hypothetical protein n=1 Tax=Egbenema bharatensis TaxID=3463334 RepID=UPI003A874DF9